MNLITEWDIVIFRFFMVLGIIYFIASLMDIARWWNGSDENGNPR